MTEQTPSKLPPDPEEMNDLRSEYALEALRFFAQHHGEEPEHTSTEEECRKLIVQNLSDLLCNFGHLCDRAGLQMQSVLREAIDCYLEETDHEGEQFGLKINLTRQ